MASGLIIDQALCFILWRSRTHRVYRNRAPNI